MTEKEAKEDSKAATLTLRQFDYDDNPANQTYKLEKLVQELTDEQEKWSERLSRDVDGLRYGSPSRKISPIKLDQSPLRTNKEKDFIKKLELEQTNLAQSMTITSPMRTSRRNVAKKVSRGMSMPMEIHTDTLRTSAETF